MKISWGVGITIFIIFFLLSTLSVVYYTTTVDVNLVTDNYYEKELVFQKKIDALKRTNKLSKKLKIKSKNQVLEFNFPKIFNYKKITGEIYLYNPADKKEDKKYDINLQKGYLLLISTDKLKKGYWKVEVSWNAGDSLYYTEKRLIIR